MGFLESWHDGDAKGSIVEFVEAVTTPDSPDFVPSVERVATFDNDGTLWSEQPAAFQLLFAMDRIRDLARDHPEWKTQQPFQAVLENDQKGLAAGGATALTQLLAASHAGNTTTEFDAVVHSWITTAKHPRFDRHFTELVYQPMLELLDYLRAKGFRTYIVSGGGIEFMRAWVEAAYGIPREQVVGSSIKTEFVMTDTGPELRRLPEVDFFDDRGGKPVAINKFIGRRPLAAFGNSDGDLAMLQWTAAGEGRRLPVLIHHTDADREWAYDREAGASSLDKALDEAAARGWPVVDMARDWRVVFPPQA